MSQYAVRRVLLFIPTLFIVSVMIFVILRVMPGDPAYIVLGAGSEGGSTSITAEDLEAARKALGTDKPLMVQYVSWIGGLITLDAGKSFVTGRPVFSDIGSRVPVTAQLAVMSIVISLLVALPMGVVSAARPNTLYDYVARFVSILGITMPIFWTGTLVILGLALLARWMPPLSYSDLWQSPLENLQQMIWPALVMGFYLTTVLSRMARASVLAVLVEDYVRTARAKGLSGNAVLFGHALRNALLPLVTLSGMQLGALMGGVVILEQIFAVPGTGRLLVGAIQQHDYPVVQTTIMLFATTTMLLNLGVDLLYGWIDPRVKYQ